MANILSETWWDRAFRAGEQDASGKWTTEVLLTHDDKTTSSSKAPYRWRKRVNRVRYDRHVASMEELLETTPPQSTGNPHEDKETRGFAKARQRSQSGLGTYHLVEGETRRLVQGHPSVGFCVRGTTPSGDRGVPGDEVPLLWCDGRKHTACAIVSSIGCAGQLAPAPGPPHL